MHKFSAEHNFHVPKCHSGGILTTMDVTIDDKESRNKEESKNRWVWKQT